MSTDKAENIGTRTLEMMKGENVLSFSFKKSNQAVTLAAKTKTKSDSDFPTTDIDPVSTYFVGID
jgi:uncharacterized protein YkuJ